MQIATSYLKIQDEKENIEKLNKYTDIMHFDVMDGNFTVSKTLPFEKVRYNTLGVTKDKDIHLMVTDIYKYIDDYSKLNPNNITFHIEIGNTSDIINYIKSKNIKVGLALNPDTKVEEVVPYLKDIDVILVMSVTPGAGGQKFIDISSKIDFLYNYRVNNNLSYKIEVDGGINDNTIKIIKKADIAVVGSFITDSSDYHQQFLKLEEAYE